MKATLAQKWESAAKNSINLDRNSSKLYLQCPRVQTDEIRQPGQRVQSKFRMQQESLERGSKQAAGR